MISAIFRASCRIRTDVFEVRQEAGRVVVAFAATRHVAVEAEAVVHALRLAAGSLGEAGNDCLELGQLAGGDLEIGHEAAAGVGRIHGNLLE
ncbi:hypothetical protein [Methylibium sp.]|uniref:hypothetical protein n=1 Tax=Methylibium sp. TaxID=2067992 RepID=UPI0025ECD003|nr:hypothetical protein [Methylibium sp.]